MEPYVEEYLLYLDQERSAAQNTLQAYRRDLIEFVQFLAQKDSVSLTAATNTQVVAHLLKLKNDGKSSATINRKIASLRAFYTYLRNRGIIKENPADHIKSSKAERKELEYLTIEEVDRFLSLPDKSVKGLRDKAILELLYATGIRVSELIEANLEDINTRMGFITCTGEHGKARIIPMGRSAKAAMEEYIFEVRPQLLRKSSEAEEESALFLNYQGTRITRQGLWKILKQYAQDAGIENKITPQVLRNSFAVHMLQNGADLKSLQELMGHEDMAATQVYLRVTKNRIKDVYDRSHPRA